MAACYQLDAAHFYQHCATLNTTLCGGTNISHPFFQNSHFQNFFWALSRGPRGFCPSFLNSPTPPAYPQIFSHLSTTILTSFFTVLPHGLPTSSYVLLALHTHRGAQPVDHSIHGPRSSFPTLDAVEPDLHRRPYTTTLLLLYLQSKVRD